jgi:tetratricopeptide (TPR) repeat protein
LGQTADTFSDYLRLYNDSWNDLDQHSKGPLDYEDRTLYSTWNVSLTLVRIQDAAAAELLRLIGYLGHQDLWYELFQGGAADQPMWWAEVSQNRARFNRAMSVLHNYSLVEVRAGKYSLHTCVHDWTLEYLNREFDGDLCKLAIHCIAESVQWETEGEYWMRNRRVLQHLQRLEHGRLKALIDWSSIDAGDICRIADLYRQGGMSRAAKKMCLRALRGYKNTCGAEHTSTLDTVGNLGNLYAEQGKVTKAEKMYLQALRGYEKARGAEHTSTLNIVNNLGLLYADQGKMAEAEEMYLRALRGYEKAWGAEHTSTLNTVNNLGLLYANLGKMAEAEEMYLQALRGKEKAYGAEHTLTLNTVDNLGNLYADQGKMTEAEDMYLRALRGKEKAWGAEHTSTLNTVYNLGLLHADQSKMTEAEEMYFRALRGYEKAYGAEHTLTLETVNNLGLLYADQGKMAEAEEMYSQALRGYKKARRTEHLSAVKTVDNLCLLFFEQIWKQTFQPEEIVCDKFQILDKIYDLAYAWGSISRSVFGMLGRVFLWASDEPNAQIAFQQQIEVREGVSVYANVECNGCHRRLTCAMQRLVCKRCRDIDICDECYRKHQTGHEISTCSGHAFWVVSSDIASDSSQGGVGERTELAWLRTLMKRHSSAKFDCDNASSK